MASGRIKGTAISQTVADVRRLVAEGRISKGELAERLEKDDRDLLEADVQPGLWYDNACHARLTELLRRVEGGGRDDYVVQRGADTADRLLESGLYQQLRLAESEEAATDDPAALRRSLRLLVSLSGAMYDFGRWAVRPADEALPYVLCIDVHEAEALTEMNRLSAEGFIRRIATPARCSGPRRLPHRARPRRLTRPRGPVRATGRPARGRRRRATVALPVPAGGVCRTPHTSPRTTSSTPHRTSSRKPSSGTSEAA